MIAAYLFLLCCGLGLFVLSFVAQYRVATLLRTRYPAQWAIIADSDAGRVSGFRLWLRLQHVLRSPAIPALDDAPIIRWQRIWRFSPALGWLCWLGAMALRLLAPH